jgi:2-polyprenyl-3-methyl-5-hydroxy-6-metoxy-1,4-benzoquinol methylase
MHRHLMYWWLIARDSWGENGQRMNDRSHLLREWDFESPAEQERHQLVLSAVERHCPGTSGAQVLELGCSDGVFTARLARRCRSVTACDISRVALELAAQRCRQFGNVAFRKLDIARDSMPARYDIVFAMDVLEFVHGRAHLRAVIRRLADAVHPQGFLAYSECLLSPELRKAWWLNWLPEGGDAILRLIATEPSLGMVHSEVHPGPDVHLEGYVDHVIALFRKAERSKPVGAVE